MRAREPGFRGGAGCGGRGAGSSGFSIHQLLLQPSESVILLGIIKTAWQRDEVLSCLQKHLNRRV